jgi:putative ABC transport system permease protein
MTPIPGLRRLFRLAAGRSTTTDDVAAELELHVTLRAEELVAEGMSLEQARAEALRRFGDLAAIQKTVTAINREKERAMRRSEWFDSVLSDFRQALRGLRRSPGFALGTALTLGLGIGLNTAIFSVFDGVLLRPLPFAEPDELVRLWSSKADRGLRFFSVSIPDFEDWKAQATSFARMAAFDRQQDLTLTGTEAPVQIQGARISAGLFALLGVTPALGRLFSAEEDAPGAPGRPLVISDATWRNRFGADSAALGRVMTLNGEPWTVIGVMPRDFFIPGNPAEVWMPLGSGAAVSDRGNRFLRVLGRLKPGVSIESARGELLTIAGRLGTQYPASNAGWTVTSLSLSDAVVGEEFKSAVTILLGAVGLVLLIACVNVSTMVLGRSTTRSRELAVRAALGAGTGRLGRLLLAEGLVLGAIGGAFGVALAVALVRLLHALEPPNLPRLDLVSVNGSVLALAALLAIGCGLLFGLVPLRRASRAPLLQSLREGGRGVAGGRSGQRTQRVLVVAEMTFAVLLLSGAGLLIQSLIRLQQVDLGFEGRNILAVRLTLPRTRYEGRGPAVRFYTGLLERARALPGVRAVAAVSVVPLGGTNTGTVFAVEGRPLPDPKSTPDADVRAATPGYFQLMNIPLLVGRDFTEQDDSTAALAAVISATTARRYWPDASPLGARIRVGDILRGPLAEVVGVVGDVRHLSLESPEHRPMIYFPLRSTGTLSMTVVLAGASDPGSLTGVFRREVNAMDPGLPLSTVRVMDEIVADAFTQRRFNVIVLGLFAFAALVLAGIGLYGVMAYAVSQRTHELGVRLALGAQRRDVVRMVLGESLRLVGGGVVLGVAGALLLNGLLSTMLFEVKPNNPVALIGASALLLGIALLGSFLPARRASRVDPMTTLRQE